MLKACQSLMLMKHGTVAQFKTAKDQLWKVEQDIIGVLEYVYVNLDCSSPRLTHELIRMLHSIEIYLWLVKKEKRFFSVDLLGYIEVYVGNIASQMLKSKEVFNHLDSFFQFLIAWPIHLDLSYCQGSASMGGYVKSYAAIFLEELRRICEGFLQSKSTRDSVSKPSRIG